MRRAVTVDSIGQLDGPVETALGMIHDVAVDTLRRVYVADMANLVVRLFDSKGQSLTSIGQRGSGPLDFRNILALWIANNQDVAVADGSLGMKYIGLDRNHRPSLKRVVPLGMSPMSVCEVGKTYVALSPTLDRSRTGEPITVEQVVRVLDSTGRAVRTFGDSYRAGEPLVRMMMSEGQIACGPDGTVLLALSKLPFLRRFDTRGKQYWTLRFTDFVQGISLQRTSAKGRTSIGLDPANPNGSFTRKLTFMTPRIIAVQVALMTIQSLRERTQWAQIDTYLVDVASGRAAFVSSQLPLLSALQGDRLYAFSNEPFPRVLIMKLPEK
jgi:hypothetical protein